LEDSIHVRFILATLIALSLFLVCWIVAALVVGKGPFFMDPQDALENPKLNLPENRRGRTFEKSLSIYIDISRAIIGLAVGSIALLSGYVSFVWHEHKANLPSIQAAFAYPTVLLSYSVMFLVIFMSVMSWRYETYLQDPGSHTRFWYSLDTALGFSGLFCFALGYISLSYGLLLLKAY
jgi:hypothetical protein